jgi:hypothetical protein
MGCASGTLPGQIGICTCPADGCQTTVFPYALPHPANKNKAMVNSCFTTLLHSGAWPDS